MTLNDAFNKVLKTKENEVKNYSLHDFAQELGIELDNYNEPLPDNIKGYWLSPWKSEHGVIGISLFFIDNKPLAVVMTTSSGSRTSYEFCSEEIGMELASLISTITGIKYDNIEVYVGEDMDDNNEEVEGHYTVSRTSDLLSNEGYYQGEKVTISKTFEGSPDTELWRKAIVVKGNGDIVEIHMDDFYIPCQITTNSVI